MHPEMHAGARRLASFLNGIVYQAVVKSTESAEYLRTYHGNGHHWAQEMGVEVADLILTQHARVFPYWLRDRREDQVWRVVSTALTPLIHDRVRRLVFIGPNLAFWMFTLYDSVVRNIFNRSEEILKEFADLEAQLEFEDPHKDPRSALNLVAALRYYENPASP